MAKRKLLKVVVLAGTLALMSCGDSTSDISNAINTKDPTSSADAAITSSGSENLDTPASSAEAQDPASSADAQAPTSSADAQAPASSADAQAPASSNDAQTPASSADAQAPASSADAQTPASSADAQAPASSNDVQTPTSSTRPAPDSAAVEEPSGIFLAEGTDETKRHLDIEYKEGQGPDGQSVLAYPKQLSDKQKHGVVVWGPGGGEKPGNYPDMIKDLAAQGFVVIGIRESPGDGSLASAAIDWLEKENTNASSPFNGKLELTKVGCSGHSMGGLESEQAAIKDSRVVTAFLNNSGDRNGGAFKNIPATKTVGVVFGEVGIEHDNAISDYNSATTVPACMIEMTGGPQGSEGGWGHGSGPWDGRAITIAWMRWQLGGEDFRKDDFVGTSGKYINGAIEGHQGKWKGQCKNF